MITTSKIKQVVSTKPFTNSYGTVHYHCLVMENGNKINIGKKSIQKEGWELTYEITEQGQQEYDKAVSVKLDQLPTQSKPTTQQPYVNNDSVRQRLIVRQSMTKEAIAILCHNKDVVTLSEVKALTEELVNFVFEENQTPTSKEPARQVVKDSDLPF